MANIEKRISKDGVASYRAKIRIKGAPAQSKTFPTLASARIWASRAELAIKDGKGSAMFESGKRTLDDLIDRFLKRRQNSNPDTIRHLLEWKKQLGSYTMSAITPAMIADTRDKLADGGVKGGRGDSTLNRYLAALSVAFSYAVNELSWLEANPVSRVKKLKEPLGRVRYLLDDELNQLLSVSKGANNPYLYPVVLLAMTTGARKMEILGLRWTDIDWAGQSAFLNKTKNGERRGLPLVDEVIPELQKLYSIRGDSEFLFPSNDGEQPFDIKRSWDSAIKKAGIEDFHFHDLRHTFMTYLAMNGASQAEMMALAGHKTPAMTNRYTHISNAHNHSVAQSMVTNKIFGGSND